MILSYDQIYKLCKERKTRTTAIPREICKRKLHRTKATIQPDQSVVLQYYHRDFARVYPDNTATLLMDAYVPRNRLYCTLGVSTYRGYRNLNYVCRVTDREARSNWRPPEGTLDPLYQRTMRVNLETNQFEDPAHMPRLARNRQADVEWGRLYTAFRRQYTASVRVGAFDSMPVTVDVEPFSHVREMRDQMIERLIVTGDVVAMVAYVARQYRVYSNQGRAQLIHGVPRLEPDYTRNCLLRGFTDSYGEFRNLIRRRRGCIYDVFIPFTGVKDGKRYVTVHDTADASSRGA